MIPAPQESVHLNSTSVEPGGRQEHAMRTCPACCEPAPQAAMERYGKFELFACNSCKLHFWEPRIMPDARWYEQLYGGRDEKLLPLEPGHRFFLKDPQRPGTGDLLDIGCGTGNFLAAAREAGYAVTGTELDRNAAQFARERVGLPSVLDLTLQGFVAAHPDRRFDVVTFFEVLEHQTEPGEFLKNVKRCLRDGGCIALSVPNRERWLTGPDVLDYPPNHFLRWSKEALRTFLSSHGFEVISMREQAAGIAHIAKMFNVALRTGMTVSAGDGGNDSFRDVMQMAPEDAAQALTVKRNLRWRVVHVLARTKYAACFPLALAAWPFIRMRGFRGTYLYCMARMRQA